MELPLALWGYLLALLVLVLWAGAEVACLEDECVETSDVAWRRFLNSKDTKSAMIQHLQTEVWARLVPSSIEGVGVQAVREIPEGTLPFSTFHPRPAYMSRGRPFDGTAERLQEDMERRHCHYDFELVVLPQSEVMPKGQLPALAKLATDFYGSHRVGDEFVMPVPLLGPNAFDISWYVNYAPASEANLEVRELPQCRHEVLVAKRDIEDGEELTFDYSTLDMSVYFR